MFHFVFENPLAMFDHFIQFAHELKKSEAGKKGSKLVKVEVWISIDVIKVINSKSKVLYIIFFLYALLQMPLVCQVITNSVLGILGKNQKEYTGYTG